jgi:hypothetical protein
MAIVRPPQLAAGTHGFALPQGGPDENGSSGGGDRDFHLCDRRSVLQLFEVICAAAHGLNSRWAAARRYPARLGQARAGKTLAPRFEAGIRMMKGGEQIPEQTDGSQAS